MEKNLYTGYGCSIKSDPEQAVQEAVKQAKAYLGDNKAHYAFLFITEEYDHQQVLKSLYKELGTEIKIHGLTSCTGVMTRDGFLKSKQGSLAIMLFHSDKIRFGVGHSAYDTVKEAEQAGTKAIKEAIKNAGKKEKDTPQLIIMNSTPGGEEAVIKGIEAVTGNDIPVFGGSCADNAIKGNWTLYANNQIHTKGVIVTAVYSRLKFGIAFRSGCVPTEKNGFITKADGHRIYEIDHKPAGQVYNDWTDGLISDYIQDGGNILMGTTLSPLGRSSGKVGEIDFYLLSHPEAVGKNGSYLDLFTTVHEGERIYLMSGTKLALIQRAGAVTKSTSYRGEFDKIDAAIVIYCAGCMLTVDEEMPEVIKNINQAIGDGIYIGGFTFGEQGCFPDQINRHGNLMIAVVAFSNEEI